MDFDDPRETTKCCPIDGHRCYCEVRRWEIEQWHKKRVESARKYKKMEASQQIASEISIDDF